MPVLHDPILKCLSVLLSLIKELTLRRSLNIAIIWFPLVALKGNDDKLLQELRDYQTANETEPPKKKKKSHTSEEGGHTSDFLFGFYWWTWNTNNYLKNCWSGPIKNK